MALFSFCFLVIFINKRGESKGHLSHLNTLALTVSAQLSFTICNPMTPAHPQAREARGMV